MCRTTNCFYNHNVSFPTSIVALWPCSVARHPDLIDPVLQAELEQSGEQRVLLLFLPLYHAYGMIGVLCLGSAAGAKLVTLPRFEPNTFLSAIEKYKVLEGSLGFHNRTCMS